MTERKPVLLTEAEIEQVAAAQGPQTGLVNVGNVLNNDLNNNHVAVGVQAAVGVLSGILQRQGASV